jgi:hypothetical protein
MPLLVVKELLLGLWVLATPPLLTWGDVESKLAQCEHAHVMRAQLRRVVHPAGQPSKTGLTTSDLKSALWDSHTAIG